jgi:hypothetical protein
MREVVVSFAVVAAVIVAGARAGNSAADGPREVELRGNSVFLLESRLGAMKQRVQSRTEPTFGAFQQVREIADAGLDHQPKVPKRWHVPPFYQDKDGHQAAKGALMDEAGIAYALALSYRMTGDERYAQAAGRIVLAWATGIEDFSRAADSTLSFSYHFPPMIFAAALIRSSQGWGEEQEQTFRHFLRARALPMNTMDRDNNWGNWGLVLVLAIAAYLEDDDLLQQGITRWKQLIETQIAEDGHLPHEVGRNGGRGERGIWYSHFTLLPQTIAAQIARVNGVDLFDYQSPGGRSLALAFARLAPWARDPTTFPYYKGDDPAEQAGTGYVSYYEMLHTRWPNADAAAMLDALRPLSARHGAPFLTFTHGDLPPGL